MKGSFAFQPDLKMLGKGMSFCCREAEVTKESKLKRVLRGQHIELAVSSTVARAEPPPQMALPLLGSTLYIYRKIHIHIHIYIHIYIYVYTYIHIQVYILFSSSVKSVDSRAKARHGLKVAAWRARDLDAFVRVAWCQMYDLLLLGQGALERRPWSPK